MSWLIILMASWITSGFKDIFMPCMHICKEFEQRSNKHKAMQSVAWHGHTMSTRESLTSIYYKQVWTE
jgi:hypothetical protein